MTPLFSIIIPTFNRAQVVSRAINSVLTQSFQQTELIVVDDGSNDNTGELLKPYVDGNQIQYLVQKNAGVGAARNRGAKQAQAKYLLFLDSDDELNEGYLSEVAARCAENPDIIFVSAEIWQGGSVIKKIDCRLPYGHADDNGLFLAGSFIIRKDIFESAGGYDELLKYGENTELSFRLKPFVKKKVFIRSFLLRINQLKSGRPSTAPANLRESAVYVLKKHEQLFKEDTHTRHLLNQVAGVASLRMNQYADARRFLLRSYWLKPWKIKTLMRLVLSCWPMIARQIYK